MNREPSLHRGPVAWMARHGVAPNLFMALLIIGGFLMSLTIKKEFIPSYDADTVIVDVAYAGATPAEIEQAIILPIENEVAALDGIKDVSSVASASSGRVILELVNVCKANNGGHALYIRFILSSSDKFSSNFS